MSPNRDPDPYSRTGPDRGQQMVAGAVIPEPASSPPAPPPVSSGRRQGHTSECMDAYMVLCICDGRDLDMSLPENQKLVAALVGGDEVTPPVFSPSGVEIPPPSSTNTSTSGLKQRDGDQVLPRTNDNPVIQDLVQTDIEGRKQVGIQRYGTPLQGHNGRDMLRDAYEEALDLTTYLRGVLFERDGR